MRFLDADLLKNARGEYRVVERTVDRVVISLLKINEMPVRQGYIVSASRTIYQTY